MNEAKFTKGEWQVSNDRVGIVDRSDSQSYGMLSEVAFIDMYNFDKEECEANANLIACASEMYKMLDEIAHATVYDKNYETAKPIFDLLEKARGEK